MELGGLVDKLPSSAVVSSPKLQMALAWADALLYRTETAHAALERVDAALETMQGSGIDIADLRVEARVADAAMRGIVDRTDGLDDLVDECLSRPDTLSPFVVSTAVSVATFSAICRFDFDAAHRWQEWASPYHKQNSGPYAVMYGHALDGIASFEQLDLERAEQCVRAARQVACRAGAVHSQAARLAGALLAVLLYERGETAEAERLLDESFKLGAQEGAVDMIIARFVVGARLAVLRGDRAAAGGASRRRCRYRRATVHSAIERQCRERARAPRVTDPTGRPSASRVRAAPRPVDGLDEIAADMEEDTAIRLLITDSRAGEQRDVACRWAQEWVDRLNGRGRHRASLRAERLLAACLSAAGRTVEAKLVLGAVLARCADVGMVRFPIDGGERLVSLIAEVRNDQQMGRSDPMMPHLPMSFLDRILDAAADRGTKGMDEEEEKPTA